VSVPYNLSAPPVLMDLFEEFDVDEEDVSPHWHVPVTQCDHRAFQCESCCPHPDDGS